MDGLASDCEPGPIDEFIVCRRASADKMTAGFGPNLGDQAAYKPQARGSARAARFFAAAPHPRARARRSSCARTSSRRSTRRSSRRCSRTSSSTRTTSAARGCAGATAGTTRARRCASNLSGGTTSRTRSRAATRHHVAAAACAAARDAERRLQPAPPPVAKAAPVGRLYVLLRHRAPTTPRQTPKSNVPPGSRGGGRSPSTARRPR